MVVKYQPSWVFMYEGDNDLAMGQSPEEIASQFEEFSARLAKQVPGAKLVFVSARPSIAREAMKAKQHGLMFLAKPIKPAALRASLNHLKMLSLTANLGDTRSIASHPASTTHRQLDEAQQLAAGVGPDMIRISVGLEHIDDILWDIDQALSASARG